MVLFLYDLIDILVQRLTMVYVRNSMVFHYNQLLFDIYDRG